MDPATTDISSLSLHDALPIYPAKRAAGVRARDYVVGVLGAAKAIKATTEKPYPTDKYGRWLRSEEHTSELQSHHDLVCRLLLEKKKKKKKQTTIQRNGVQ